MTTDFYSAQLPYMHLNHSLQLNYQDREHAHKRIVSDSITSTLFSLLTILLI